MRNLIFVVLLCGCTSTIELKNFNQNAWKLDLNGCGTSRILQAQSIVDQKANLLGESESAIIRLLGAPDKNELFSRSQKIYRYYTLSGPDCTVQKDSVSYLSIRFNAVGLSSEVLHYQQLNN